jgi:predicted HNH restriction endonuclease
MHQLPHGWKAAIKRMQKAARTPYMFVAARAAVHLSGNERVSFTDVELRFAEAYEQQPEQSRVFEPWLALANPRKAAVWTLFESDGTRIEYEAERNKSDKKGGYNPGRGRWRDTYACFDSELRRELANETNRRAVVAELTRQAGAVVGAFSYPEEVDSEEGLVEGAARRLLVNAFERDPEVRRRCIDHHGVACAVCGMSFAERYGEVGDGYIHVHHLKPLSEVREAHEVDPVEDLRPVCPNCHAVIHRRTPPYDIDEVRAFLRPR